MEVSIEHVDGDANKPLALHVNGELVPFQTGVDLNSHPGALTTFSVQFVIHHDGVVVGSRGTG